MTYRSSSPRQKSWDVRAAANFACGGAGTGSIVFAALSGEHGPALASLIIAGLALVAIGLASVWHETGRPLRALHVVLARAVLLPPRFQRARRPDGRVPGPPA